MMEVKIQYVPIVMLGRSRYEEANLVEDGKDMINRLSREGWELKATAPIQNNGRTLGIMHYFQREVVPG